MEGLYRKRNRTVFLALYPPRRGRTTALLIYLVYLHHLILYARWRGHIAFAQAYATALQDALAGQLGARQLPSPSLESGEIPPDIQTARTVWIDMPSQRGDALAISRLLQDHTPSIISRIIDKSVTNRLATLDSGHQFRAPSVIIVGENYRLRTALQASIFYQYRDGQFLRLHHPLRHYTTLHFLPVAALLAAIFPAIPDCWRIRSRYRYGLPPSPLDKT